MLKSNNTSGHTGVSWSKSAKKWQARVKVDGENKNLGFYVDAKEASAVYQNAKKNLIK